MSLRLVALGTGVCSDTPYTTSSRQPPGFLVSIDGLHLLFDCSEGIRFRLQHAGISIADVTHIALSHGHPDHAALPQFIQTKYCHSRFNESSETSLSLRIYLSESLARDFPHVWNWHQPENQGRYWEGFEPEFIGMADGFVEKISPHATLKAYHVYHGFGQHPAMGFRLETPEGIIAYTGDTGVCEGARTIAQGADLLIADCSIRIGQEYTAGYGHMGPRQCGDLARATGVKELWLTHYFDFDAPQALLAEVNASGYFGTTKVAQDGERWEAGPAT